MKMNSKIFGFAGLSLAAVIAAALVVTPSKPQAVAAEGGSVGGVIAVTGEGSVKVKPDIAYVTLGVTTVKSDAQSAQKDNAEKMAAVNAAVKALGIKEEDIATSNYSINPNYDYSSSAKGTAPIVGYTVNNSIKITVKDINNVSGLLDKAVAAGANSNASVNFSISDKSAYVGEAFAKAMENAKGKANAIARSINVGIGVPSSVTENSSQLSPYSTYPIAMASVRADSTASTPIEAGELEVYASVVVEYKY